MHNDYLRPDKYQRYQWKKGENKFNTEGFVETWMIMNIGERSLNLLQ